MNEQSIQTPASGPACHRSLRRYWFTLSEGIGIGVTAAGEGEARAMAEQTRAERFHRASITSMVVDVDVSTLDPDHVLPYIGPTVVRGVWFPPLNLSGRRDRPA